MRLIRSGMNGIFGVKRGGWAESWVLLVLAPILISIFEGNACRVKDTMRNCVGPER